MQAAFRTRRLGGYVTPKPSKRQILQADFVQPAHPKAACTSPNRAIRQPKKSVYCTIPHSLSTNRKKDST
ncbi:hypothetical protein [Kingella denitrificans]|uniref:hypothetical protein n=1 Tax=Kingella denitrificans TaxID=502 RepID=UPI0028D8862E|nr:hypothetical protein [Kingella denitrificans]